jgi:hypothetical protein
MNKQTGCLVCAKDLVYTKLTEKNCYYCGKVSKTEVYCKDGHYICDNCHKADSLEFLETYIRNTKQTDPIIMLEEVMNHPSFKMHGPEHHYLVPAIVLTAMKNLGIEIVDNYWQLVLARCSDFPGGTCGYWGACAGSLSAGVAVSILKECTPLKKDFYGELHQVTSSSLAKIAQIGGPRCCKRNIMLSIYDLIYSLEKIFDIKIKSSVYTCSYMKYNKECLYKDCPYFPKKEAI